MRCGSSATPAGLVVLQRRDRDICGVISGSAAAVISARVLLLSKSGSEIFITLLLSAVVSGMTVGGKACGKSLAMNSSTAVVRTARRSSASSGHFRND